MTKKTLWTLMLGAGLLLCPSSAEAQGGIPSKKEIEEKIRAAFPQLISKSPEEVVELEGILKITYKAIPTDPKKVAKLLGQDIGGGKLPAGVDIDQHLNMFLPQITALLNENMQDLGTFEVLKPLKAKFKKIPVGKHRFGLLFNGERPEAIMVFDPPPEEGAKDKEDEETRLKKPVPIRLKTRSVDMQEALKVEFKEPKKQKPGEEKFDLQLAFLRYLAKTKDKLKVIK